MHKQETVFFDVDDTLVKGQSQKLFIKFLWKRNLVSSWFYARLMFWFLLYRLHIIKDPSRVATHAFSFLKNIPREKLSEIVDSFFDEVLVHQFYQDALSVIKEHQKDGRQIFLVSNAFDALVEKISRYVDAAGFIATKLRDREGILTGELDGSINYGKAKADRVIEFCKENDISLENSWGYADHPSDIDFLKLMNRPVMVNQGKSSQNHSDTLSFLEFSK